MAKMPKKNHLAQLRDRYGKDNRFRSFVDKLLSEIDLSGIPLYWLYDAFTIGNAIHRARSGGDIVCNSGRFFGKRLRDLPREDLEDLFKNSRYRPYAIAELNRRKKDAKT
jgi:hypothetical protein